MVLFWYVAQSDNMVIIKVKNIYSVKETCLKLLED